MKLPVEKDQKTDLEQERDRRLMRLVAYAMNDGLKAFPVNHAKGLHKMVAEYMEICALLDSTYVVYHPTIDGMNEP